MAKLDLSALKKQKITSETPLVSLPVTPPVSPSEGGEASIITASVIASVPPEINPLPVESTPVEPRIMRTFDNPHKPKLSLSSIRKSNSNSFSSPVSDVAPPAQDVHVVEAVSEVEVTSKETETIASSTIESSSVDEKNQSISTEVLTPATILEIPQEVTEEKSETELENKDSSGELFPNLQFEKNNLFEDIDNMGLFDDKKEETSTELISVEDKNDTTTSESNEPVIETVVFEELPTKTDEEIAVEPVIASENSSTAAVSSEVSPEYVEAVATELSKDRKGGLSELFEKKRKVFYGVGALVFTSILTIGGLSAMGIIDVSSINKASVTESPQVVAVNKTPQTPAIKKFPEIPVPVLSSSGSISSDSNTATGKIMYPSIAVTSSGTSLVIVGTGALIPPKETGSTILTGAILTGTGTSKTGALVSPTGTGSIVGPSNNTGSLVVLPTKTSTGSTQSPKVTTSTGTLVTVAPPKTLTGTIIPSGKPGSTINTYRTPNIKSKKRK